MHYLYEGSRREYRGIGKLVMRIEHIGIAVKDLNQALNQYLALFPEVPYHREQMPADDMEMVILHCENIKLELIRSLKDDSPIGKFIEKSGEGLHHIAFKVGDIYQMMEKAGAAGIRVLTETPYIGAEGCLVCFMHPKDTSNVLCEFCQCQAQET